MGGIGAAFKALFGAVGDMFSGAMFGQVVIGVVLAVGLVFAAVLGINAYLVPLIPAGGEGALGMVWASLRFLGGLGALVIGIVVLPPIVMFVGGLLFSRAKERIETQRLGIAATPGSSLAGSAGAAVKVSVPSFITNLAFLPAWAIPVLNVVGFIVINAFVSGRAYFDLAAGDVAKPLKARHGGAVFLAGLPIAVLMLIPAAQFLVPSFGAAVMTRLRHGLPQPEQPAAANPAPEVLQA